MSAARRVTATKNIHTKGPYSNTYMYDALAVLLLVHVCPDVILVHTTNLIAFSCRYVWCRALSRRYFCAKEFVSRKKKILKSSLVEMLLLPKGTDPLEDFSIGAILTEFFLCEPSNLATC